MLLFSLSMISPASAEYTNWETPHVHPMDITPNGNTLLSVNTPNNALEVYSISTSGISLSRSIPVGLDPVSVRARSDTQAWVVNQISDSVSVVDLTAGTVIATLDTDDEPADIVFAGSPIRAFVSNSQSNSVQVFNPNNLATSPQTIAINGEDPRALAVSRDGLSVYVAIFESGNGSTILSGGRGSGNPGNVVDDPIGPYGGVNPPPNSGNTFNPPQNPVNATAPAVSMIVRKDNNNRWMDDNNRDWSQFVSGNNAPLSGRVVGWDLPDRDVAIINTSTLAVTYQNRVMTTLMAMDVNPANGQVSIVGTEADNQIRYEPNLRNTFIKVNMAQFTPGAATDINDLNPHLNYNGNSATQAVRNQSIGDPRGIKWNSAGTVAYITGMGSNNVVAMNSSGARLATINVGEGPTGIALHESSNRAFVLNKFGGSISIINLDNNTEAQKVTMFDPTPAAIKTGRKLLYDTQLTSGLGQASCASCHIDARHDRLAWDLGNPAGETEVIGGIDFHPMKGPMRTQTLLDIIGVSTLHFRGDKATIHDFSSTYTNLQGLSSEPSNAEMQQLEDYLATIHIPPNPYRNIDNSRPASIAIPGPGNRVGNPMNESNDCTRSGCHDMSNKARSVITRATTGNSAGGQPAVAPPLRNQHELLGLHYNDATASNAGFAFIHDGSFSPTTANTLINSNNLAFMLAFNGDLEQDSHAAVGKQLTISGTPSAAQNTLLTDLLTLSDLRSIGLVAHGIFSNESRGFYYQGQNTDRFQSDSAAQTVTLTQLLAAATPLSPITFTAVPAGAEQRIGVDRDEDGTLNNDEITPPPVGIPDTVTLTSSATVTINPLANDTGTNLTLLAPNAWSLRGGNVALSNNTLRYTPKPGFNGEDKIWYNLQDDQGRRGWSEITLNVSGNASAVNVPPVANPETVAVASSNAVTIDPLANDTGTGLTLVAPNAWSLRGGNVALASNRLSYQPKPGFNGQDKIWYTIRDTQGRTSFSEITINVSGNGATIAPFPIANADTYTVPRNSTRTLNILANDTPSGLAIDTLYAYSSKGGTTTKTSNQQVLYTPKTGFIGVDDFWYVLIDSQGRKNSAQVTINVTN